MKQISILTVLILIASCGAVPSLDQVIPDRRTEYQKSEALPDLEVPPDLTREGLKDPLEIPNEEATTLSEFERQKSQRRAGVPSSIVAPGNLPDENYVIVQGSKAQIWADLRAFWDQKGYELEIDDPELGVMETVWEESESASGLSVTRNRFTLFTEDGDSDSTLLLVSNERQEQIPGEDADWVGLAGNTDLERQIVNEMNLYFYGTETPGQQTAAAATSDSRPSTSVATQARAEVLDLGDEKLYLSLPEEFTRAWTLTENALKGAGLQIEDRDRSKGLYYVLYYTEEEKDEGLLDKLAFWSDGPEPTPYQISLTGVGEKTELVVLDNEGEWDKSTNASRILTLLQAQYNAGR